MQADTATHRRATQQAHLLGAPFAKQQEVVGQGQVWGRACYMPRRKRAGTSAGPERLLLQQQQFWLCLKGLPDVLAWKKMDLCYRYSRVWSLL